MSLKTDMISKAPSDYWIERTVFPGKIPKEVKFLVDKINTIDRSFFRKLIKLSLGYVEETLSHERCEVIFAKLSDIYQCENLEEAYSLCTMYSGVISLLKAVLKINLKTVREDMLLSDLKDLGFPEEFAADVSKVVFGSS